MSLIECPECGWRISSKAITCPHCGYQGTDSQKTISEQHQSNLIPEIQFKMMDMTNEHQLLHLASKEDTRKLSKSFSDWDFLKINVPAIADAIEQLARKDQNRILIANLSDYTKELIQNGTYTFSFDKCNEILPTLRDSAGKIVQQVRLKEYSLPTDIMKPIQNIQTNMYMVQILQEVHSLGNAVNEIHLELQNDRVAKAEAVMDFFSQALQIRDWELRREALLSLLPEANEARRSLMKHYESSYKFITDTENKPKLFDISHGDKTKEIQMRSEEALEEYTCIACLSQILNFGYTFLNETKAASTSVLQFKNFINQNKLGERDTLLLLNENIKSNRIELIDEFMDAVNKIESSANLEFSERRYIEEDSDMDD